MLVPKLSKEDEKLLLSSADLVCRLEPDMGWVEMTSGWEWVRLGLGMLMGLLAPGVGGGSGNGSMSRNFSLVSFRGRNLEEATK